MTRTFRSIAAAIGLAFAPTSAILAGGCPLDLDSSGAVDGADLGVMLAAWGTATHDATGDGVVDGADLGILLSNWGSAGAGDLDGSGTVDGIDLGLLLGSWS